MGLLVIAAFLPLLTFSTAVSVSVKFGDIGSDYSVSVNDVEWFRSSSLRVRYGGQVWSTSSTDQYMLVASGQKDDVGEDSIGTFARKRYSY